jgi:hypothetical protein
VFLDWKKKEYLGLKNPSLIFQPPFRWPKSRTSNIILFIVFKKNKVVRLHIIHPLKKEKKKKASALGRPSFNKASRLGETLPICFLFFLFLSKCTLKN